MIPSIDLALKIARRYAQMNMLTSVRVSRMAAPVPSPDGSSEADEASVVYEGVGHLSVLTGPLTMGLGDSPSFYATTQLSIPVETGLGHVDPVINDMVEVLDSDDPTAVGRVFRVTHVMAAGLIPAVRTLQLTGWEQSNRPPDVTIPPEWLVG